MKNWSKKISASFLSVIPFLTAIIPHPAFASVTSTVAGWFGLSLDNTLWQATALLSELEMAIAGSLVTITGALLNATMTATLNMAAIVNETPAVGIAWTTVRNFGSVFIIFMLLYASIKMVLGDGSGVGKLIKNIVIAGLLINFSLFFTKLAVDASNIISLSFYTAIAPTGLGQTGTTVNSSNSAAGSLVGLVSDAFDDGGLANVFMQSLDLQSFANTPAASTTLNSDNKNFNITLANSGASVLMFFAAVSFLVAGLAFAVRIGVLILLMAFSPIYFIAMIFPDLDQYAKKWTKMLYSMCIFMPVYLFLMYVAMSVLNDPNFFDFAKVATSGTNITGGAVGSLIGPNLIGAVLQYIIAIFLINAPLFAAISVAGEGADFMSKMMKNVSKWGQGAITSSQKWAVQNGWRETGGRAASTLAKSERFQDLAARYTVVDALHKGTQGIAGNYNEAAEARAKKKDERRKELGYDERKMARVQNRIRDLNVGIAQAKATGNTGGVVFATLKNQLDLAKQQALDIETARAKSFAARTSEDDTTLGGLGGLYNKLTRSNPIASAKAKIFVHEKEVKRAEEDLADSKKDLSQLEKDIRNSGELRDPNQPAGPNNPVVGNAAQQAEKARLLNEIAGSTKEVRDHKNAIEDLKLKAK